MKNYFLLFSLFVLSAISTGAQTHFLVGPAGGIDFNNESFGLLAQVRAPITKHFEVNFINTASPIETHLGLGNGFANLSNVGGIVWVAQHFGLGGSIEYSMYNVTEAKKGAYYVQFGPVFRFFIGGFPARLSVGGVTQIHNGIAADGTESSRLKGGSADLEILMGCSNKFCILIDEKIDGGRVLKQSNPVCDGTFGDGSQIGESPCPRPGANGGGFSASLKFQFPRRKDDDEQKLY